MRIDPEFKALIAPLLEEERQQLEENLVAHGCRDPLVTWRGILIDGHNRYEICTRLKIHYRTVEVILSSRERVLLWIEENQLGRRNLTEDQRSDIAESIRERKEEIRLRERAKKGRAVGGKATPEQKAERRNRLEDNASSKRSEPTERSRRAIAKQARVPERKLRAIREIKKALADKPEVLAKTRAAIRSGEKTIAQTKRDLRKKERERRVEDARQIAATPDPARCQLFHGDLATAPLDPECADVIITDPPYPKEFLSLFSSLAEVAVRCLKPGGSLLVMSGQIYLPAVIQALMVDGLQYHWTVAYLMPGGQAAQVFARKVNVFWKPVLWFTKGAYQGDWVGDVVKSAPNDNDKRFHGWGQSESGMAALVERFSLPGQTILDPFVGGGATGFAALKLGRRFIGVDSDESAIQITKARLCA